MARNGVSRIAGLSVLLFVGVSFEAYAMRPSEVFKKADADKDGYVSIEELKRTLPAMFAEYDQDHDGFVDHDEMVKWLSNNVSGHEGRTMPLPAPVVAQVAERSIKSKDVDRDGKMSFAEFSDDLVKSFGGLDSDHDGRLSLKEMTIYNSDPPRTP